jgi:pimeloyl-ACP methyl ester carboxylesterase
MINNIILGLLSKKDLTVYDINEENKEVAKVQRSSNMGLIVRALFSMKAFRKKTAEISCYTKRGQTLFYRSSRHYTRSSFATMQRLKNVVKNRDNHQAGYPTFILTAEFDIDLAKEMAKSWHSDLENSEYFMIKDAGHCANLDKPEEFNKRVKDFLDRNN